MQKIWILLWRCIIYMIIKLSYRSNNDDENENNENNIRINNNKVTIK